MNNNSSLSAFFVGGAHSVHLIQFLSAAPNTCSLVGNLCACSPLEVGPCLLLNNSSGTMNIRGNLLDYHNNGGNPRIVSINPIVNSGTMNISGVYTCLQFNPRPTVSLLVNGGTGTLNLTGAIISQNSGDGILNSGNVNVFGTVEAQISNCISHNAGTVRIIGQAIGGFGDNIQAVISELGGSVFVSGSCLPRGGAVMRLGNTNVNIIGTLLGGSNHGLNIVGNSVVVNLTGNVFGGTGSSIHGINCQLATATANVFGTVTGGSGTTCYGIIGNGGVVNVFGSAIGGSNTGSHGVFNNANAGRVYVERAVGNDFGLFSFGQSPISRGAANGLWNQALSGRCYVGEINCGSRGMFPVGGVGPIWLSGNKNTKAGYATGTGGRVTMITLCANSDYQPRPQDVRFDLYYDEINNPDPPFGFLHIPRPSQVANGTPVDNTLGTATFENPETIWNVSLYDPNLNRFDDGLATPESFNWSFGNRVRESATLNTLSSVAVSLNNQRR
jgi:hypothetical protein